MTTTPTRSDVRKALDRKSMRKWTARSKVFLYLMPWVFMAGGVVLGATSGWRGLAWVPTFMVFFWAQDKITDWHERRKAE